MGALSGFEHADPIVSTAWIMLNGREKRENDINFETLYRMHMSTNRGRRNYGGVFLLRAMSVDGSAVGFGHANSIVNTARGTMDNRLKT